MMVHLISKSNGKQSVGGGLSFHENKNPTNMSYILHILVGIETDHS